MTIARYILSYLLIGVFLLPIGPPPVAAQVRTAEDLPSQIGDSQFWKLIQDYSEPGGEFRLENFMSNERTYQKVIPALERSPGQGGVYIGVGPEQNFTYILAVRPKVSFIVDIRRQNLLEHLLYKSLFEQSTDRADFLSKLFSRKRPESLTSNTPLAVIFRELSDAKPDKTLYASNVAGVVNHLLNERHLPLLEADQGVIMKVYSAFFTCGPQMDFHCLNPGGGFGAGLTYAELMQQEDGVGRNRGYLASEENFRYIQNLQRNNLIIPLVGDFAGPKAIRAVGNFIREHNATTRLFYLSNVEDYLFGGQGAWRNFYENVATLPLDERSVFIRVAQQAQYARLVNIQPVAGEWVPLLSPMAAFIREFRNGKIGSLNDVIMLSK